MPIVRAYFLETQEMVFDAHEKTFAFRVGRLHPASGREKDQVENQVGTIRDFLFLPKPTVKTRWRA